MPELTMTKHFENNWQERVGGHPTPQTVTAIIRTSVRIQKSMLLRQPDGTPYRVLAIYWHPELDIIIKLDPRDNCAVTVMSRTCWRYDGEPLADDKPLPASGGTISAVQGRQPVFMMRREKSRAMTERTLRVAEAFAENRRAAR